MEFTDRGIDPQESPHVPPIYGYLTDKPHRAYSMGPDIGQTHQELFPDHNNLYSRHLRHSLPSPNPQDLHESIQFEIEKEKIREEIIISEIARRRVLEAEVRRELMMERESTLQTSGDGFSSRLSSLMELVSPMGATSHGSSLDERITSLMNGKREGGRFETLPPQRGTPGLRVSEVIKPVSEGSQEKKKLIFLGKPDENASGLKAGTPHRVTSLEIQPVLKNTGDLRVSEVKPVSGVGTEKREVIFLGKADENISGSKRKASSDFQPRGGGFLNKKPKEEWICSICQINCTSERSLNDHFRGRKHRSKEAASRAADRTGKNDNYGLHSKKGSTVDGVVEEEVKLKDEKLLLLENLEKDSLVKFEEKVISEHKRGRKHTSKSEEKVNDAECIVAEDENIIKGNVDVMINNRFVQVYHRRRLAKKG